MIKHIRNHKIIQIILLHLMMVGIILGLVFKTLYMHTHYSATGEMVMHAHPLASDESKGAPIHHHHSESQLFVLQHITDYFDEINSLVLIFFVSLLVHFTINYRSAISSSQLVFTVGRAPPMVE